MQRYKFSFTSLSRQEMHFRDKKTLIASKPKLHKLLISYEIIIFCRIIQENQTELMKRPRLGQFYPTAANSKIG